MGADGAPQGIGEQSAISVSTSIRRNRCARARGIRLKGFKHPYARSIGMSDVLRMIAVMVQPRITTVDKLNRGDLNEVVRFVQTDRTGGTYAVEAVLLNYRVGRMGYQFRLRFLAGPAGLDGLSEKGWFGPLTPWQQVEVLAEPSAAVSLGDISSSGLGDHLDPAQLELLAQMREKGQNEN